MFDYSDYTSVKNYIDDNATIKLKIGGSWRDTFYGLKLFTYSKGLYSGMVYNDKRIFEFIMDFNKGTYMLKGLSHRPLSISVTNIRNIFPTELSTNYQNLVTDTRIKEEDLASKHKEELKALADLLHLGKLAGAMGSDSDNNPSKGLYRIITYFPFMEQLAKANPDIAHSIAARRDGYSWGNNGEGIASLIAIGAYYKLKGIKVKSLQEALGLTKGEYKLLLNPNNTTSDFRETISYTISSCVFTRNLYRDVYYEKGDGTRKQITIKQAIDSGHLYEVDTDSLEIFVQNVKNNLKKLKNYLANLISSPSQYIDKWLAEVDEERNYEEGSTIAENLKGIYNGMFDRYTSVYSSDLRTILEIIGETPSALKPFVKYLYASCYHQQALDVSEAIRIIKDYYNMVSKFDEWVKYPRYLKVAHDIAVRNSRTVSNDEDIKSIGDMYNNMSNLERSFGDYVSVVLSSPTEIVSEGNQMHHCVGSYVPYVAKGRSIIIGIRSKDTPKKSWITVELKANRKNEWYLSQVYGQSDSSLTSEQNDALKTFMYVTKLDYINDTGKSDYLGGTSVSKINSASVLNKQGKIIDEKTRNEIHATSILEYQKATLSLAETAKYKAKEMQKIASF